MKMHVMNLDYLFFPSSNYESECKVLKYIIKNCNGIFTQQSNQTDFINIDELISYFETIRQLTASLLGSDSTEIISLHKELAKVCFILGKNSETTDKSIAVYAIKQAYDLLKPIAANDEEANSLSQAYSGKLAEMIKKDSEEPKTLALKRGR